MSLDVSLIVENPVLKSGTGVYVRRHGKTVELTKEEVKEIFNTNVIAVEYETTEIYENNITHNLTDMADAVKITENLTLYDVIWRPEEQGIEKAGDLISYLNLGLIHLRDNPELYKTFNPSNGWGSYDVFVDFVESYYQACVEYPNAKIEVSR